MAPLPTPVRAAIGLVAALLDEAKTLPDKAIEVPMVAVSRALKLSLHAQQRYSALAARGDELLAARQLSDEPPAWATFDEPVDDPVGNRVADPAADPVDYQAADPALRRPRPAKRVSAPRTGAPSAFDSVVVDDAVAGDAADPVVDER